MLREYVNDDGREDEQESNGPINQRATRVFYWQLHANFCLMPGSPCLPQVIYKWPLVSCMSLTFTKNFP